MVVVTGAAGHLGAALVRELIADGEKVRAFVLPGEDISGLLGLPLEIVRGNILQRESIVPAVRGAEVVYHLAGIVSIMPGRDELMRRVNVEGSANVARAAREAGVPKMVYVSSIHALQRPASGIPIDERVPFDPHNAAGEYDQTKAEASLAVLAEADKGLDAVIVCPTGIIGPFDFRGLSPMTRQIRAWTRPGRHLMINGHFDFVDARDVGRGMILAARRGGRGSVYILSWCLLRRPGSLPGLPPFTPCSGERKFSSLGMRWKRLRATPTYPAASPGRSWGTSRGPCSRRSGTRCCGCGTIRSRRRSRSRRSKERAGAARGRRSRAGPRLPWLQELPAGSAR